MSLQKWEAAVRAWDEVLKHRPDSIPALNRLGIAHTQLEHYERAEVAFRQAIDLQASEPSAYFNLALLYLRQDRTELAETWLNKTLECASWYPETHYHLGYIRVQEERFDEAIEEFVKELGVNPASAKAWHELFRLQEKGYGHSGGLARPSDRSWNAIEIVSLSVIVICGLGLCGLASWRSSRSSRFLEVGPSEPANAALSSDKANVS